jgi:hypothetical protein
MSQFFEGHREQGIPGEDGSGFIETDVASGATAPQIVIVHCGQIVVDQGVAMDHFDGTGGGYGFLQRPAERLVGQKAE